MENGRTFEIYDWKNEDFSPKDNPKEFFEFHIATESISLSAAVKRYINERIDTLSNEREEVTINAKEIGWER